MKSKIITQKYVPTGWRHACL
ncbi:hypothetical protein IBTHAUMO2_810010 [Nitrosopumilaceae archaeon]|nr:hypothetical protein IBTHAUMO2_810010 [Nitrosopumilaceae archaeon]